jgi:hypothetical protein
LLFETLTVVLIAFFLMGQPLSVTASESVTLGPVEDRWERFGARGKNV